MQPGVVLLGSDIAEPDPAPILGGGPGDDPLDQRAGRVGAPELLGPGLRAGRAPKVTVRPRPICRAIPAGQVTVPWSSSMVKSSTVNPPGTAERSGPG